MWVKNDNAGMAALPDGTTYEWSKAGDTIEVDDDHGTALCEIAGFTEMVDGKPAPKRARKKLDAGGVSVVGEPQAPIPATVTFPEPSFEETDVTVEVAPDAPAVDLAEPVAVEHPETDSMAPPLVDAPPTVTDPPGGQSMPGRSPLTAKQGPAV